MKHLGTSLNHLVEWQFVNIKVAMRINAPSPSSSLEELTMARVDGFFQLQDDTGRRIYTGRRRTV